MGLPVVAADLPAAREAVAPAFHQYFCDPRDATALADAIADVLERRAADATLRQQAVSFGRQFSVAATCEAMRAAWRYPGAVAPPDPAYWAGPRGGSTPAAAPATTSRN
jgi:glycosyltransferase involved in cell wall biosynthesis